MEDKNRQNCFPDFRALVLAGCKVRGESRNMVEDVAASCQLIQGHFGFNGGASGIPSSGSSALGAGLPGPSSSSSSAAATAAAGAGAGATNAGYSGASCSENMQVGRTKQYFFFLYARKSTFLSRMANGKKRRNISSCARFALMMMTRYIFSLGHLIFLRETNKLLCLLISSPLPPPRRWATGSGWSSALPGRRAGAGGSTASRTASASDEIKKKL